MSHDNPQLTAYLLGELTPAEVTQLEEQLAVSPALREELDALRGTITALQSAFAQHVETQPAVPAINREKLHSLLRSAVVAQSAVGQTFLSASAGTTSPSDRHVSPTVVAPSLLVSSRPRASTSRGWLLAGAVLVVGGLVTVSQFEPKAGLNRSVAVSDRAASERDRLLRSGQSTSSPQELAEQTLMLNVTPGLIIGEEEEALLGLSADRPVLKSHTVRPTMLGAILDPHDSNGTVAAPPVIRPLVRILASAASSPTSTPYGTVVLSDDASLYVDAYAVDAGVRFALPQINTYFRSTGVTNESLFGESARGRNYALGESRFGRTPHPEQHWGTDGEVHWGFATQLSNTLYDTEYATNANGFSLSRAKGRSLQRGGEAEGFGLSPTQGLDLLTDLSVVNGRGATGLGLRSVGLTAGRPALSLSEFESKPGTERLRELSEAVDESAPSHAASSLPQSLTVAEYENGFTQLGQAVQGWGEFHSHWDRQRGEALGRGTQPAPPNDSAPTSVDFDEVTELSKLVADQQTEFKSLREKTPGVEGQPLSEVAPEVAKNAQLALFRVRRELAREQAVWYYREGYVRQLEATIAAAESYAHVPENDFTTPEAQPLSTFGIDVDTASYSNVRRFVESNQLPPPDAVRIEELVNSFKYEGPPVAGDAPLAVAAEVSVCPWQPQHQLLRVALKGKSIDLQKRPPARLVFLVDTSGSMSDENKLPLVKQSLRLLVEQMREQDRLSIVTYSDNAGLLLDSTGGDKREAILAKIDALVSDGSTNGEAGLKLAYEVAVKQFAEGATNRVMLCTDGDFNVGESSDSAMVKLIEKERQTGVFLNIFGFGSGNLKDAKLEAIADKGNGQYIYIDGIKEARKTLLNELTGTLYTIAKDVKLQIEFNPALVGSYRLVGYENRVMAAQDFANDKVDSGDLGAGHSVVALYEIIPPGVVAPAAQPAAEPLKYQRAGSVSARSIDAAPAAPADPAEKPAEAAVATQPADPLATELCTIRVRYKQPTSNESTKIETVVAAPSRERDAQLPVSRDHVWATAVAEFGLVTKHSSFVGSGNYSQVLELAQSAIGDDPTGQRREFVTLVRQTQHLTLKHEARLAELSDHLEDHRRAIQQIKAVEQAPDLMTKASCSGKYKTLLRQIEVADDLPTYGEFKDFGQWEGAEYKTHKNLPHGYWVYAAPHWYIWGESTEQAAVTPAK